MKLEQKMFRASSSTSNSKSGGTYTGLDFYWQDPNPSESKKNWLAANIKSVRATSSINKSRSNNSLSSSSAKFIPGLTTSTTNPKYAHVQSKVRGELGKGKDSKESLESGPEISGPGTTLRSSKSTISTSTLVKKPSIKKGPIWGGSAAANAPFLRPSKSTTDIRSAVDKGEPQPRLMRHAPLQQPQVESVYNWRFNDVDVDVCPQGQEKDSHFHRIEYIPCDGICKDEVVDSGMSLSSGRSSTSRGVNTEETRIYPAVTKHQENYGGINGFVSHGAGINDHERGQVGIQNPKLQYKELGQGDNSQNPHSSYLNRIQKQFGNIKINGEAQSQEKKRVIPNSTSTTLQSQVLQANHVQTSNLPHPLGEIPKYLKSRQNEWKLESELKEKSALEADIPPGHILMDEKERSETMYGLRQNYSQLITELNRIPISMDTIRIRERRTHIEQQLDKIEQAMRVLERPRVYVKM